MVTLKGSTAEAMTLAFCAYVTEGLLEILADEELRLDEIGAKAVLRVSGVLGEPLESADLRAMAMRIRTATLELPPVSVRIGNVQMALSAEAPEAEPGGSWTFDDADRLMEEGPAAEGATVTIEEISTEEIAAVLATAGLDVVVLKGPASAEKIAETIAEPEVENDEAATFPEVCGAPGGTTCSECAEFPCSPDQVETDGDGEEIADVGGGG